MKSLICFISLFILLGNITFAQTYNPITGKQDFKDSLKFTKYGNAGAGDSVLTVDPTTKKLKFVKNGATGPIVFNGVDSVTYDTASKTMCVFSYGLVNCFIITTNAPPSNSGVDSVVVNGTQLCTYTGGVATCYTVNTTINNNSYITNYIDSSIVVNNFNNFGIDSNSRVISGSAIIDSNFDGHTTSWSYKINGIYYTAAAVPFFQITASNPSADRYTVAYLDTLGNFGLLDGPYSSSPVQIPSVDASSQLAVALYYIPAGSTTPYLISNTDVYKEAVEWTLLRRTITSGFDSVYAVNPYAGLYSIRIPQHINGQYWEATDGADHLISDFSFLSFHLRLAATFPTNSVWGITLWYDSSVVSSNEVRINTGTYGYNRTVSAAYQGVSVPTNAWNMYSGTFNKIRFTQRGNTAVSQQFDNIVLQTGGTNTNNVVGIQSVNNVSGTNIFLKIGNILRLSADSSYYELVDSLTNTTLRIVPTFLTYLRSADTCLVIDTIDSRNFTIGLNPYCVGSGSGGITALTGDVTASGTGSVAATLATVNSNVGSFTNANITVNGKGLITAASNGSAGSGTVTSVAKGYGIVADGTITTTGTITADSAVLASKAYADALAALKLNIGDTASMLGPYFRDITNPNDTTLTFIRGNGTTKTITFSGNSLTPPNTIKKYLNGYNQYVSFNTDSIPEGSTNLWYTDGRARASISLTTTGTSGAATYNTTTGVLNIPQYSGGGGSGWALTGNSGITAVSNFLGTTDAKSLRFRTNNIERLIIDSSANGLVGIGTSSPSYKVDITNTNLPTDGIRLYTPTSTTDGRITFTNNIGNSGSLYLAGSAYSTITGTAGSLVLSSRKNLILTGGDSLTTGGYGSIQFRTGGSQNEAMRISSNRNVSIGTATDTTSGTLVVAGNQYILSASGGGNTLALSQLANNGNTALSYSSIDFRVPTTGLMGQFLSTASNYSNGAINLAANSVGLLAEATSGQLALISGGSSGYFTINTGGYAAAQERLRILSGGRVGIGLTAPTGLLHLAAGTTAVSGAPEKFTAGSLNTTIEPLTQEANASSRYESTVALNRYAKGGAIADFVADVNNSGTSETDLLTYTTKASTLAATGEKLMFEATGTFNDVTATSQLQFYFGGTNIGNTGALTVSATGAWAVKITVIRTGASTARSTVNLSTPGASTAVYTTATDLTGLTFTNTNIIKITGTAGGAGGSSNDITAKMGTIFWWGSANN